MGTSTSKVSFLGRGRWRSAMRTRAGTPLAGCSSSTSQPAPICPHRRMQLVKSTTQTNGVAMLPQTYSSYGTSSLTTTATTCPTCWHLLGTISMTSFKTWAGTLPSMSLSPRSLGQLLGLSRPATMYTWIIRNHINAQATYCLVNLSDLLLSPRVSCLRWSLCSFTAHHVGYHRAAFNANGIVIDSSAEKALLLEEGVPMTKGRRTWKMEGIGTEDAGLSFARHLFLP